MKKHLHGFITLMVITSAAFAQQNFVKAKHMLSQKMNKDLQINTVTGTPVAKFTLDATNKYDTTGVDLYTYDSKKRIIQDKSLKKDATAYIEQLKSDYYYGSGNNTNNLDSLIMSMFDDSLMKYKKVGHLILKYQDVNKGLPKFMDLDLLGLILVKTDYYYDGNNFLKHTKSHASSVLGKPSMDSSIYQVDGKGSHLVQISYTKEDSLTPDTAKFLLSSIDSNSYDGNNNLLINLHIKYQVVSTNTVVTSKTRVTHTYNSFNNKTESLTETLSGATWTNQSRVSTFYKNNTEYDYQLEENWNASAWNIQTKYIWVDQTTVSTQDIKENMVAFNLYPNPAIDKSTISFELTSEQSVNISITDITGKQVALIVNQRMAKGVHNITTDISNLAGGLYFVKFNIGNAQATHKLMVQTY